MSKKEKVNLHRGEAFDSTDEALSQAMSELDAANARILELLESETLGGAPEPEALPGAVLERGDEAPSETAEDPA